MSVPVNPSFLLFYTIQTQTVDMYTNAHTRTLNRALIIVNHGYPGPAPKPRDNDTLSKPFIVSIEQKLIRIVPHVITSATLEDRERGPPRTNRPFPVLYVYRPCEVNLFYCFFFKTNGERKRDRRYERTERLRVIV